MATYKFTSCFVGIPLPREFQLEFEQLIDDLSTSNSYAEPVQKTTLHLTLYYLDEQSQDNLHEIAKTIEVVVPKLRDCELTVGGFGAFGVEYPRVLYLSVVYPAALKEVNSILREQLNRYYAADNNLPFHPHVTVARILGDQARETYMKNKHHISGLLNSKEWKFAIQEVVIYGVNSHKEPEGQEKLLTIKV